MFGKFCDPILHKKLNYIFVLLCITLYLFSGAPLVFLVDLLNGSIGVEEVTIFLAVDELLEALDGVIGSDAMVGIGNSFLFMVGVYWKV